MKKALWILGIVVVYAVVVFINLPLETFCMQDMVCFQQTLKEIAIVSFCILVVFVQIGLFLSVLALETFIVTPTDIERDVEEALRRKEKQ